MHHAFVWQVSNGNNVGLMLIYQQNIIQNKWS